MKSVDEGNENIWMCGKGSIRLREEVAILSSASVAGTKESKSPFGTLFDVVSEDGKDLFQGKSWEEAESNMQKLAVTKLLEKARMEIKQIRYIFSGDLLGQNIATSFGLKEFQIPLFGLYGACSMSAEALILGAVFLSAGYADYCISLTSSHYASAEKEYRFPLGYGGQRPSCASWTVTGSGAFLLGKKKENSNVVITGVTPGKIVDYGVRDSFNMGCAMAPAAADTIKRHFEDFARKADEYDAIITGDLGIIGAKALKDLLNKEHINISNVHIDCGAEIFGQENELKAGMDTHAGGSGSGCAAIMLSGVFLPKLEKGEWSRILFVATGALLNKTSFNEGNSVPAVAHAVVIERTH